MSATPLRLSAVVTIAGALGLMLGGGPAGPEHFGLSLRVNRVEGAFPGANGKIAFSSSRAPGNNYEIYAMNPNGTAVTRLTNNRGHDADPAWSPDGSKIAFSSDRDGNGEIYVMNADGTAVTRLTNDSAADGQPAWSPDGAKIAFSRCRFNNCHIYVMDRDGSGLTNLSDIQANDSEPAWSPDGLKIAFSGLSGVSVMNADGTAQTSLSDGGSPAWSPDGSQIAFARGYLFSDVYVMNADGSNRTNVTHSTDVVILAPAWSPDGSKITFDRRELGVGSVLSGDIYVMNSDGSGQTNLTSNPAVDGDPDWQPIACDDVADVNGDSTISSIDAALILQFGGGLIASLACQDAADVNGNGAINSVDAALIFQYVAGLIHQLPQ